MRMHAQSWQVGEGVVSVCALGAFAQLGPPSTHRVFPTN